MAKFVPAGENDFPYLNDQTSDGNLIGMNPPGLMYVTPQRSAIHKRFGRFIRSVQFN